MHAQCVTARKTWQKCKQRDDSKYKLSTKHKEISILTHADSAAKTKNIKALAAKTTWQGKILTQEHTVKPVKTGHRWCGEKCPYITGVLWPQVDQRTNIPCILCAYTCTTMHVNLLSVTSLRHISSLWAGPCQHKTHVVVCIELNNCKWRQSYR